MSSTERAPEPTMEEILASIRRIISDDESSAARPHPAAAKQPDDEGLETADIEADDKIIDDIARVLSSSQPQVEDEEDILDLTAELGGAEIVEDASMTEAMTPVEMPPPEIPPAAEPEASAAPVEAEPPAASPPLSASEEAASALERAIAALRAGHLPTSVSEFMPTSEPASAPWQPLPEAAVEAASEPEPAPAPEPEPVLEFEAEPQLAMTDLIVETVVEDAVMVEPPLETYSEQSVSEPMDTPPWARAPEPRVEPERFAARGNGGTHDAPARDISNKSLEDSVKDMLRPMLRQWLDGNMPRMVTTALKDELGERQARGHGE